MKRRTRRQAEAAKAGLKRMRKTFKLAKKAAKESFCRKSSALAEELHHFLPSRRPKAAKKKKTGPTRRKENRGEKIRRSPREARQSIRPRKVATASALHTPAFHAGARRRGARNFADGGSQPHAAAPGLLPRRPSRRRPNQTTSQASSEWCGFTRSRRAAERGFSPRRDKGHKAIRRGSTFVSFVPLW